jgi:hypothetical protein
MARETRKGFRRIERRAEVRPERPMVRHGSAGVTRSFFEQPMGGGEPVSHRARPWRHAWPLPAGRPGPLTGRRRAD